MTWTHEAADRRFQPAPSLSRHRLEAWSPAAFIHRHVFLRTAAAVVVGCGFVVYLACLGWASERAR